MKKIYLLILSSIFIINVTAQSIDFLDQKFGYKDLKFGTLKSDLKSKIYDCTEAGHCLIIGDIYYKIRNVNIESVFVRFLDNQLFAVYLSINGKNNVDSLLDIYKETFGVANSGNKDRMAYIWIGKNVALDFDINIDNNGNVSALVIITELNLLDKNSEQEIQKNLNDL